MFKKCIVLVLSFVLIIGAVFPVNAGGSISDLQQKQKEVQNRIKEYKNKANALKNEKNNIQAEINQLDIEIDALNLEIEGYDLQKQELNMQIAAKEQEIVKLNKDIEENNKALEERLRIMYKKGNTGYLEVVLKSENLMDALTRMDMIQVIVQSDVELLKSIESQKKKVEEIQLSLEGQRSEVIKVQNNVLDKKGQVAAAWKNKEQYVSALEKDIKKLQDMEAREEAQSAQIEKDILALQRAVEYAGGEMQWPLPSSYKITSPFGKRPDPITGRTSYHRGIDIGASSGSTIVAANDGVVIFAGSHYSYGNYIIVDHGGGISTLYAHCTSLLAGAGQSVKRGQKIATVGSTGYSTGPHLHFEVRKNGVVTNPMSYLK